MRNLSLPVPIRRSQVHLTSAAVNGLPSCHLTPWCSGKVSSLPSSLHSHLVARSGTIDCRLFCATCWSYKTRLLNTPIIGCSVARVDSSRIDMLAGLSKCWSRRMPPAFCADAGTAAAISTTSAPAANAYLEFIAISQLPLRLLFIEPDVFHAPAVEDAVDHDRQPLDIGLPADPALGVKNDRA